MSNQAFKIVAFAIFALVVAIAAGVGASATQYGTESNAGLTCYAAPGQPSWFSECVSPAK